jgi:tetratricopeptide (TPR) repeat protein
VSAARGRELTSDEVAALEEERDFLLRSLDDLEAEREAGDVDDADYLTLKDDYTARAAAVLRALDRGAAPAPAPSVGEATPRGRGTGRVLAWGVAVVVFALLAGVLVARTSGRRSAGDVATGNITPGAAVQLSRGDDLIAQGAWDEAIAAYTDVIDQQPSNVRALTYRGWAEARKGDLAAAWPDLDAAVGIDPAFPDARVFRALLLRDQQRWDDAAKELAAFDLAKAPLEVRTLLAQSRLVERILTNRVVAAFLVASPPPLASSGFTAADVRTAAEQLAEEGRVNDAIRLLNDVVLAADPSDAAARASLGWVFGRSAISIDPTLAAAQAKQLIDRALRELDRAVQLDASLPQARVYRAFVLQQLGRNVDAAADLNAFDTGADKPPALVELIRAQGLREALNAARSPGATTTRAAGSTTSR